MRDAREPRKHPSRKETATMLDTDPATANERPAGDYVIADHHDDTATG